MAGESIPRLALKWVLIITIGRRPKWTLVRLGVLIVLTFLTYEFALLPIRVTGISMEPTYHNGSINVINRLSYLRKEPERGDVVGIKMAGEHVMLLKRVVGLPGEKVSFSHGVLLINDVAQNEPYLKFHCNWSGGERQLGSNEYFYVGDNRSMRREDHEMGAKDRSQIVGKVLLRGT